MPIDLSGLITPAMKFAQAKSRKLGEIDAAFEKATAAATAGYPQAEQISWPQQYAEAQAWQTDNTAPTPVLDAIAQGRGVDRLELIQRALAMQAAMTQMAPLIGIRQRLRDAIDAAKTQADLDAIHWPEPKT